MSTLPEILRRSDAGESVATIAAAVSLSPAAIYKALRKHRPARKRSPRTRTAELPMQIRALAQSGAKPARIATVLGVSRAYVYRCVTANFR